MRTAGETTFVQQTRDGAQIIIVVSAAPLLAVVNPVGDHEYFRFFFHFISYFPGFLSISMCTFILMPRFYIAIITRKNFFLRSCNERGTKRFPSLGGLRRLYTARKPPPVNGLALGPGTKQSLITQRTS